MESRLPNIIWKSENLLVAYRDNRKKLLMKETKSLFNDPDTIGTEFEDMTGFAKHWLDLQGYDITKRQPEIAPCPFCGHDCEVDVAINKHGRAFIGEKKQVYCEKDVSCGYRGPFAFTAEEAIEKHNLIAGKDK